MSRVLASVEKWAVHSNERTERVILAVSAVVFVAGSVWAYSRIGDALTVTWSLVAINALVGVPLAVAINAVEFQTSSRLVDLDISGRHAAEVSVLGSAANLLPLPGAALVRIRALRQHQQSYGRATRVTTFVGVAFIGVASAVASISAWLLSNLSLAIVLMALALLSWVVAAALGAAFANPRVTMTILAIELGSIAIIAFKFWLSLRALGTEVSATVVGLMAASSPLASAAGIVPGGLGLREAVASVLASSAGLDLSTAFLAVALDRVVELVVTGVIAGGLVLRQSSRSGPHNERPTPE